MSTENVTDPSEGVPESFLTSGGYSTLQGIARRQADERFVDTRMGDEGEGMVRVPPVEEMFLQESSTKERRKYYPSQSVKSLLKEYFDRIHPLIWIPVMQLQVSVRIKRSSSLGLLEWRCRWHLTVCLWICC